MHVRLRSKIDRHLHTPRSNDPLASISPLCPRSERSFSSRVVGLTYIHIRAASLPLERAQSALQGMGCHQRRRRQSFYLETRAASTLEQIL